jgi:hypothetical protein
MTKAEFISALEHELRLRGRAFSRADVQEFVAQDDGSELLVRDGF